MNVKRTATFFEAQRKWKLLERFSRRQRFVNEREKDRNVFRGTEKMETTRAFFETLRKWKLLERG